MPVIIKPIISERSLKETARKRYTFAVDRRATKTEIAAEAEKILGIKVIKVTTMVTPGKSYRRGRGWGWGRTGEGKKAVIWIKPEQTIDLFGAAEKK